jgi:hypothetical protein
VCRRAATTIAQPEAYEVLWLTNYSGFAQGQGQTGGPTDAGPDDVAGQWAAPAFDRPLSSEAR